MHTDLKIGKKGREMQSTEKAKIPLRHITLLILFIGAGITASILNSNDIKRKKFNKMNLAFESEAKERISILEAYIENHIDALEWIVGFYKGSQKVERVEFAEFVQPYLQRHPEIKTLKWIPRVPHSQRQDYENTAKADGFTNFRITQRDDKGYMVPAQARKEYFPVFFVEPYKNNETALGFDIASNPTQMQTLQWSCDNNTAAATEPTSLVQEYKNKNAVLFVEPIYKNGTPIDSLESRRENLTGFVILAVKASDLLDQTSDHYKPFGMDLHLCDVSTAKDYCHIGSHISRTRKSPFDLSGEFCPKEAAKFSKIQFNARIEVANRIWEVICLPSPTFIEKTKSTLSLITLAAGIAFTYVLSILSLALLYRANERKQAEETLRKERNFSNTIIETAQTIILVLDTKGRIISFNPYMEEICGYSIDQVRGKDWFEAFLPQRDRRKIRELFKKAVNDIRTRGNINPIVTKDGREVEIEWYDKTIKNSNGKVTGVIAVGQDITERKKTEQKLQYFQKAVEDSSDAIGLSDPEGIHYYQNKAFTNLFGYTLEETAQGQGPMKIYRDENIACNVFETIMNGNTFSGEVEMLAKNGQILHINLNAYPIKENGDKVVGLVGIHTDITNRKQAEQEILNLNQQIEYILGATNTGLDIIDPDFNIRYIDPQWKKVYGDTTGRKCYQYFMDRDEVCPGCGIVKALNTKTIAVTEEVLPKENNRPIQVTTIPFKDSNGQWLVAEVNVDITERKKAEKKLKDSYKTLQKILDSMPFGVITIGTDKIIRRANRAAVKMAGYNSTDELIDQLCHTTLCPAQKNKCPILDMNQQVNQSEKTLVTKDGTKIPILKSVIPINIDGEDVLLEAFINISDLKKERLQKEKLEAQLRQTQKMEALGTLAGGIAHDFNNILGALIGYTGLAQSDVPEGTLAHQNLQEALIAANRAKELVKQILTFSRKDKTELIPVQINSTITEALKMLRSTLPATIEIRQNIDSDSTILADETQIHQVIVNLCTNAVHAMEDSNGTLEVKLNNVNIYKNTTTKYGILKQGKYVRLSIKDTGCGINKETQDRIFEPFYTTKEPGKGTGLGLSVIHGIVKSHKGMITIDSKPGQGTTFKIYFPSVTDTEITEDNEQKVIFGNSEHILFIDDEKPIVDMAEQMLQKLGYKVTTETSSTEALKLFQQQPDKFDLVITDQIMPELKGLQLAQKILNIRPDIPIILCTGYSEEVDLQEAKSIGVKQFVFKPLTKEEISRIIHTILDTKGVTV